MLVSHLHQFIYLKTRKTASSSIEGLLEPYCRHKAHSPRHRRTFVENRMGIIAARAGGEAAEDPLKAHSGAEAVRRYVGDGVFDRYTKIYAVRNPFDKVVSWFWHVAPADVSEAISGDFDKTRSLFSTWLRMRPDLPVDTRIYATRNGPFKAEVVRYETIGDDLARLGETLGLELDQSALPSWKAGVRRHEGIGWSDYYTEETAEVVRHAFRAEFARFGYDTALPARDGATE